MGQEYGKWSSRSISIHSESMGYTKTVSDGAEVVGRDQNQWDSERVVALRVEIPRHSNWNMNGISEA